MKRVVSYDPLCEAVTWWRQDSETGESLVWTEQNVDALIDWNKKLANEAGKRIDNKHPLGTHTASVPLLIYQEWVASGKINDQAYLRRWLNDPDNRFFRTNEMKL